jgi:hypothetical protein
MTDADESSVLANAYRLVVSVANWVWTLTLELAKIEVVGIEASQPQHVARGLSVV